MHHTLRGSLCIGFPFVFNSDKLTEHVKWNCDMTQENDLYLLFNIKICLYINGTREAYWNDIKNIPFQWHFESINIIRVWNIIYRGCLHIICWHIMQEPAVVSNYIHPTQWQVSDAPMTVALRLLILPWKELNGWVLLIKPLH